ncbi:MAG: inositol monophosphatase [candidate division Zixibacteria bacterium]|nr:inositol monophosphatase [candidate division Zixibacteria bacterium]
MAIGAGGILKAGFNRAISVKYKGRIDPVTEYDLKSERHIVSLITKKYPDHAILAEEGSGKGEQAEFRWIIDPLDGTVDYAHGFPIYCVSIGLEHEGKMIAGVVYDPERNELFRAAQHRGAFLNKKRIRVSSEKRLDRALLATGFAYDVATARKNNLGLFARMVKNAQAVRRLGSAAIDLCWLAAGRIDGFWELKLHPWDTAAALVIVEEAGGKVTQLDGEPYSIFAPDILAANPKLRRTMQKVLTRR